MFNQVLIARKAWIFISNPGSLCAQVLKARYYPDDKLEDTLFAGNASFLGKPLLWTEVVKRRPKCCHVLARIQSIGI